MGCNQDSAVEWFANKVLQSRQMGFISNKQFAELLSEAKEMEKVQRSQANNGNYCAVCGSTEFWYDEELDSSIVDDDNNEYDDD